MVREEGIEPSNPYGYRILSPVRLPISPLPQMDIRLSLKASTVTSPDRRDSSIGVGVGQGSQTHTRSPWPLRGDRLRATL